MGRGVAFHKQKGDLIQEENVDKVFEIKDKNTVNDLTTLLANVPLDFVTTSYDLIDQVQAKYKFAVEPYIYVTLTTHLFGAYQRLIKDEKDINHNIVSFINNFYKLIFFNYKLLFSQMQ